MDTLRFDLSKKGGYFKPMNAVNNGPVHNRRKSQSENTVHQVRSNLLAFKEARIPYARNHDASFCSSYGSEHTVDITAIFPDFDADPYNPESYDFIVTDEYVLATNDANVETFYRLGERIEHYVKKYNTLPPKDFKKWAIICEHVIRHYTEGWANGYKLKMTYWEIWNEADQDPDDSPNKRTWGGTKSEFFDFYEIAAKHLKGCFPHLKIGGPAYSWTDEAWAVEFLAEMKKRNVPIDFFSWHIYNNTTEHIMYLGQRVHEMLVESGYENTESILNEWNYLRNWSDKFVYSITERLGMRGAAFTMAIMSEAQHSTIDMLMYYDARPCLWNGLFDFYTLQPLKGYYPMKWYGMFYDMKSEILCEDKIDNIYTLCGCDENEKTLSVITYYTDDDENAADKTFTVDFGRKGAYEIYLLDNDHDAELINTTDNLTFTMKQNTCIMIKEK